jgi:hypothetical protein
MIDKHSYDAITEKNDVYRAYVKAITPLMGNNPYVPRIYVINQTSGTDSKVLMSYKMETLHEEDTLDNDVKIEMVRKILLKMPENKDFSNIKDKKIYAGVTGSNRYSQ